jgi:hypothetical protein
MLMTHGQRHTAGVHLHQHYTLLCDTFTKDFLLSKPLTTLTVGPQGIIVTGIKVIVVVRALVPSALWSHIRRL